MSASDTIDRSVATCEQVRKFVESWGYMAPELSPRALVRLYEILSVHFGTSNARAEITHVGEIVRSIERRKAEDPTFAGALEDYVQEPPMIKERKAPCTDSNLRERILEALARYCTISDVALAIGFTRDTVKCKIEQLCKEGEIYSTHNPRGGAGRELYRRYTPAEQATRKSRKALRQAIVDALVGVDIYSESRDGRDEAWCGLSRLLRADSETRERVADAWEAWSAAIDAENEP